MIDRKTYNGFRNLLNTQIRKAKSEYYTKKIIKNEGNIKEIWKTINNAIKSKRKFNGNITLKENELTLKNNEVPNSFNNYFTGVANKLTSQLPPSQHSASSYLKNRISNTFSISPITKDEISKVVNKLKYNGKGSKIISTMVLKDNSNTITEILMHIFNICVVNGYFPNEPKIGCITPISKVSPNKMLKNCKPVC